jgi:RHS repeat-associated protein
MKNESNNIETHLSDTGDHACNAARPHAVASTANGPLGAQTYAYDANDNLTAGAGRTYLWTAANKVRQITQTSSGQWTRFAFDADRQRIRQTREDGIITTYVGDDYEKVEHPNGLIEEKHYILTPLGRSAVRTVRNDGGIETRYFHADGLGTIHAVTDEWGRVEKRYYYDAWGKQMEVANTYSGDGGKVTRGFTDHEMLDDFGLIHLNARLYDPEIGRFISADRYVQDIGNSQTYNRYSYCANNPVNTFDPTGNNFWDWLGGLWDSLFGSSDEVAEQQKAEATPSDEKQIGTASEAGAAGATSRADASAQTGSVTNPSATQGISGAGNQTSEENSNLNGADNRTAVFDAGTTITSGTATNSNKTRTAIQRREFLNIDAAGAAASREARSTTKSTGNKLEYSGEIYSYAEKGKTLYGYTTPKAGLGPKTFIDNNGDVVTVNQGAPLRTKVAEGAVVGFYHSHTTSNDFSGNYPGQGGDALVVESYGKPLYLGRESMAPFSPNTVVRVMELNNENKTITRTIGSYKWRYE